MLTVLKFLFGSGWWVAWYLAVWGVMALFVGMPLKMLIDDALKTPPPTPSLGTFGYMMIIPVVVGAVTLVDAIIMVTGGGGSALSKTMIVLGVTAGAVVLMSLGEAPIVSAPGRMAALVATATAVAIMAANLTLLWLRTARTEGAETDFRSVAAAVLMAVAIPGAGIIAVGGLMFAARVIGAGKAS